MIVALHLLEFNGDMEITLHTKRIFARARQEDEDVYDAIRDYLPDASPIRTSEHWYNRGDDEEIIDQCGAKNYFSQTIRRSVVLLSYGTPVQEWNGENVNPYRLENDLPPYVDGYLDKYEPSLDLSAYAHWMSTLSIIEDYWTPLPPHEEEVERTREETVTIESTLRAWRRGEGFIETGDEYTEYVTLTENEAPPIREHARE